MQLDWRVDINSLSLTYSHNNLYWSTLDEWRVTNKNWHLYLRNSPWKGCQRFSLLLVTVRVKFSNSNEWKINSNCHNSIVTKTQTHKHSPLEIFFFLSSSSTFPCELFELSSIFGKRTGYKLTPNFLLLFPPEKSSRKTKEWEISCNNKQQFTS